MAILNILNKLKNKHFLSLAGNGAMSALSMVTYAILYRVLPEVDMGNWVFFQFMFSLIDSIRTGFLQTALIKFYSGSTNERKLCIAGSSWYIAIIITILFALLNAPMLFALNIIDDSGIKLFIHYFGICLICTLPFNVAFWILQAEEQFDRILILRIINQGSFILYLVVLLVIRQTTLQNVMYFYLISSICTSAVSIFLGWSKLSSIKNKTAAGLKEMFHFGKFSVGTHISSNLLRSSDSIIIKFMIGPAALAVYNLAQRVGEVIELLIRSLLGTAMPSMAAAFNRQENGTVVYIMKKYAGALTIILVPVIIGMIVFADVFVLILGGPKYQATEAANLLRIFMCLAITFPIDRFMGITLDIIHKPHLNMIKVILTLIINVVADVIALKLTGNVYGAAVASFITLIFGICFGYFTLRKYLDFNLNGVFKLGYDETKLLISSFRKRF
ncbi:MAG: lipopolysaccharide biosynthesis protein [Flavobacterium sp.]|nr:MAG: lipopolysaccharide biosynthesis protein [Flavobacterium sp.]